MVARAGIGATAAAAVVFSILLASNAIVFAASRDREHLYGTSDAEDSLGDGAAALMGAGGMNILMEAQAALASRPLDCQQAQGDVASVIGALSDSQRSGGVDVESKAWLGPGGPVDDNLTLLAPFNGSVPGELDVSISMVASGRSSSGDASIDRSEVHLAHLPVELDRLAEDCIGALGAIEGALSTEAPANCTSAAVGPLVRDASRGPAAQLSADGFGFAVNYDLANGGTCSATLTVQVQQNGIRGPAGPFTVRLEEEGVAPFR